MSWYERSYRYGGFAPYVPVAQRRANAEKHARQLAQKEGRQLAPIKIAGRAMATTFWGKAWCDNLEAYSDYANRLPRGRTYARNGSVIDLQIKQGKIEAIVSGSHIYDITISIETLAKKSWTRLKTECSESIASLIDLLRGRFDAGVMQRLAHPTDGLFPQPDEIKLKCSCPDWAGLCKHVAAVLYGVGNRLDTSPELLFKLRKVDHLELVSHAMADGNLERSLAAGDNGLAGSDLSELFGIDLDESRSAPTRASRAKQSAGKSVKAAPVKPVSKPLSKPGTTSETPRKSIANPRPAASKTPAAKTPAAKTPAAKTPAAKTPAAKTPASKAPSSKTLATKAPVTSAPVTKASVTKPLSTKSLSSKTHTTKTLTAKHGIASLTGAAQRRKAR